MKIATSALIIVLTSAAVLADEHRALKAHEHGHGTLDIAIAEKRVSLVLEVPGMDILGFERAARGKDQEAAVEQAKKALAEPLALFEFPSSAGCKVTQVRVDLDPAHEHGEEHDRDGDAASGVHEHQEEDGHSEVHATYALECAKPQEITAVAFKYFTTFRGAERLTVNVVTDSTQSRYEVHREKPTLELGGTM